MIAHRPHLLARLWRHASVENADGEVTAALRRALATALAKSYDETYVLAALRAEDVARELRMENPRLLEMWTDALLDAGSIDEPADGVALASTLAAATRERIVQVVVRHVEPERAVRVYRRLARAGEYVEAAVVLRAIQREWSASVVRAEAERGPWSDHEALGRFWFESLLERERPEAPRVGREDPKKSKKR